MRKTLHANGEYYHVFNRGVDGREIFSDDEDRDRFLTGMIEFNDENPIGSIFENSFRQKKDDLKNEKPVIVDFVSYCLNPNHFHFILKQVSEKGIEKFMHKLGVGYVRYYNIKNERSGALFQGSFKSIHIENNEYLLHLSAYVNLNFSVHKLGDLVTKSSWGEYIRSKQSPAICNAKKIILDQFNNREGYADFAKNVLPSIIERKDILKLIIE